MTITPQNPVLIVSATRLEIEPLFNKASSAVQQSDGIFRITMGANFFDILLTGIGIPSSLYEISSLFALRKVPFAIHIGIAGSYQTEIKNGSVVMIVEEEFGELGIDQAANFSTLFEAGYAMPDKPPFHSGRLINDNPAGIVFPENLKKVKGLTINVITSNKTVIQNRRDKHKADIETMESAAFFYCCLKNEIPFLSLRGISNQAGEMNKSNWLISESIQNVCDTVALILQNNNFLQNGT